MYFRHIISFALGALCAIVVSLAVGQTAALDPLRVAPHIYELALENERLRVLRATVRNGETTPVHSHPDRLVVHLSPCAWLVEEEGGETRMESFRFGDIQWEPGVTHGGETSNVVQECRMLEIELK